MFTPGSPPCAPTIVCSPHRSPPRSSPRSPLVRAHDRAFAPSCAPTFTLTFTTTYKNRATFRRTRFRNTTLVLRRGGCTEVRPHFVRKCDSKCGNVELLLYVGVNVRVNVSANEGVNKGTNEANEGGEGSYKK